MSNSVNLLELIGVAIIS